MELLEKLSGQTQTTAVIVVTAQGTIDNAVQAMRMGAYDYITKPIDANRLKTILQNASELLGTRVELEATKRKLRDVGSLGRLVGPSRKMQEIFRLIDMVAPSTASVLITGESGTGKEMVARTIHEFSPRRSKPFVPINCAAIPETLIESEIFGHAYLRIFFFDDRVERHRLQVFVRALHRLTIVCRLGREILVAHP